MEKFKKKLALVFDDNLKTEVWSNVFDYIIMGMILLSTLAVFISTFDISPETTKIIDIIDLVTLIFFTIEVSLRIWVNDLIDEKYSGFWGRIKYCFSFYGLIDILSTYPFYIHFFVPIPYSTLKVLRVARLFRTFRYMRSFRLLTTAMSNKSSEMFVSFQFLFIITVILSFFLYFFEHEAQPDVYDNGFKSVVWAFAQYIGDPGNFAETPPISFWGRIIACIVGVLGIAIFAVPAGLIGSGFTEAIEEDNKKKAIKNDINSIKNAFQKSLDTITRFYTIPHYLSICELQSKMGLKVDDIIDAVENSSELRLVNLAASQPQEEHPQDKLAVEMFMSNTSYGCCIDRGSNITIVSPSSVIDPSTGWFSFYLAKIGNFNYISRDFGIKRPYKSYFNFSSTDDVDNLQDFFNDLCKLTSRENSWAYAFLVASGAKEPKHPTHIHLGIGGSKGNETYEGFDSIVSDIESYDFWRKPMAEDMENQFGMLTDHQRFYSTDNANQITRHLRKQQDVNCVVVRFDWAYVSWDSRRVAIMKTFADSINKYICHKTEIDYDPDLKDRAARF